MFKTKIKINKSGAFLLGISYTIFTCFIWYQFVQVSKAYFSEVLNVKPKTVIQEKEIIKVVESQNQVMAEKIIKICKDNGLTSDEDIKWILGKLWNESRWQQYAYNVNKGGSVDRGIAMWNDYYHPEISDECSFSLSCAISEMIKYRKDGKDIWYASDNL